MTKILEIIVFNLQNYFYIRGKKSFNSKAIAKYH